MHRVLIATRKQATHRLNLLILRCFLHKMKTDMCRLPLLVVFSTVDGNASFQHAGSMDTTDVPYFPGRMPLRLHFLDEGILPPQCRGVHGGTWMLCHFYMLVSILKFWAIYLIDLICLISVDWEFFVSRSLEPAAKDASGTSSSYAYEQKPGKLRWLGTTMSRIHDGPVGWVERREISWKYCCDYRQWIQR